MRADVEAGPTKGRGGSRRRLVGRREIRGEGAAGRKRDQGRRENKDFHGYAPPPRSLRFSETCTDSGSNQHSWRSGIVIIFSCFG